MDQSNRDYSELTQSRLRIIVSAGFFLYFAVMSFKEDTSLSVAILAVHLVMALLIFVAVRKNTPSQSIRINGAIFIDFFVISALFYTSGPIGAVMYPLYLWMIFANGMRYGSFAMLYATTISVIGFLLAAENNAYWSRLDELVGALAGGIVILVAAFYKIVSTYYTLNNELEERVRNRTKEINNLLHYNTVSGLKNKYSLQKDLGTQSKKYAVIVDIKDFSLLNDIYGDSEGDNILAKTAEKLKSICPESAELYHVYDDKFLYLSNNKIDVISHFDNFYLSNKIDDNIKIEVTVATMNAHEESFTGIIEKMKMALIYAKKHHLNQVDYHHEMNVKEASRKFLYWKSELKDAIAEDRMIPVFQPIVDRSGQIIKYEALMRLRQRDGKLVSPFFFLDVAQKSGLYNRLTKIMLEKTVAAMRHSHKQFSVNLSYRDIANPETTQFLLDICSEKSIAHNLVFEIVESEDIQDYDILVNFTAAFKKLGVKVAIDDFGSGYSNYQNIVKIEPDYIKIDGSLIKQICVDENSANIVNSIIVLSSSLSTKTIAEFISSEEIAQKTLAMGIDEFQGFYYYEPLLFSDMMKIEEKDAASSVQQKRSTEIEKILF